MTSQDGLPTMKTFSGLTFDFREPTADMVALEDIAHALSQICRFGGQARTFYSVAQHCVLVSQVVEPADPLRVKWALMHDAAEAYVGDMIRPLKRMLPEFKAIEERVLRAIAARFELPWPMPVEIAAADNRALALEGRAFMNGREDEYGIAAELDGGRLGMDIDALPSWAARGLFERRFELLFNGRRL